jgi:hypothetical protein
MYTWSSSLSSFSDPSSLSINPSQRHSDEQEARSVEVRNQQMPPIDQEVEQSMQRDVVVNDNQGPKNNRNADRAMKPQSQYAIAP